MESIQTGPGEETGHPIYDRLGIGYTAKRRSDPRIFHEIQAALSGCETVVNIGAGTGSYEPANCTLAVEPSQQMIDQRPAGRARCIKAFAEKLPLEDKSFDGSLASLTIHHWNDVAAGLREMQRVSRKRVVLFTWDPEFAADFWLMRDYFPAILDLDCPRFPTLKRLAELLPGMEVCPVPIPADCEDGFIGAFWKRPEAFLDPDVQRANSAMLQIKPEELREGLARLRTDLESGAWSRRNANLNALDKCDLGYRLVISAQD